MIGCVPSVRRGSAVTSSRRATFLADSTISGATRASDDITNNGERKGKELNVRLNTSPGEQQQV